MNQVNVKDFGAIGERGTDDTAAIQKALDATTDGGTVVADAGEYSISRPLELVQSSRATRPQE